MALTKQVSKRVMTKLQQYKANQRLIQLKNELYKKKSRHDYLAYLFYTNSYMYDFYSYPHVKLACDTLEKVETGEIKKLMIFSPPQHLKSTYATSAFPSWYLAKHPQEEIIILSFGDSSATKFGANNRRKLIEYGKDIFDIELERGSSSKTNYKLKGSKGAIRSFGFQGGATGNPGDLVFIDDPMKTREQAESPVQRQKQIDEYKSSVRTRLNPESKIVLIMTRWHELDLAGWLLATEGEEWTILYLPVEASDDDATYYTNKFGSKTITLPRENGELLWQKQGKYGYTKEFYNKIRLNGKEWTGMYNNRPESKEGNHFQRDYFQYFREDGEYYILESENGTKRFAKIDCKERFVTVDTAMKISKQNDYTAMGYFIETPEKDLLIRDILREKIIVPKQYKRIRDYENLWRPLYIAVEDKQSGTGLIQQAALDGNPFKTLKADTDKITRSSNIVIKYEAKKVYHYADMSNLAIFEEELLVFPNGSHDDMVDICSYAGILTAEKKKQKQTFEFL